MFFIFREIFLGNFMEILVKFPGHFLGIFMEILVKF